MKDTENKAPEQQPFSAGVWDNPAIRKAYEAEFSDGDGSWDIPRMVCTINALRIDLVSSAVAPNADDLVEQLAAIDGPCDCTTALCDHWKSEAGIILTAAQLNSPPLVTEAAVVGRTYRDRWCSHCQTTHRYFTGWTTEGGHDDQLSNLPTEQHCLSETLSEVDSGSNAAAKASSNLAQTETTTETGTIATPSDAAVNEAAREIAADYEVHKDRCHSNERYPCPPCDCGAIGDIATIISKHCAATPTAPSAPSEHDWQWYDRNLRATGYSDLANRMLAEFKPQRIAAPSTEAGEPK